MSDISKKDLKKEIAEILKAADLSVITSKTVRKQLETKLGCSLLSRKKQIDEIVMDVINKAEDKSAESSESESESENEEVKKKPPPKKGKGSRGGLRKGTGFTRPYNLSPELSALMGAEALPRHAVVKKIWSIIKERNLYDPKNKQYAICDDELMRIMKIKRFRTFGMLKYLKPHFLD